MGEFTLRFLSTIVLISSSFVLLILLIIVAISKHWWSFNLNILSVIEYILRVVITIVYVLPYLLYTNSLIILFDYPKENYSLCFVYLVFGILMHSYYFLLPNCYLCLINYVMKIKT